MKYIGFTLVLSTDVIATTKKLFIPQANLTIVYTLLFKYFDLIIYHQLNISLIITSVIFDCISCNKHDNSAFLFFC